MTFKGFWTIEDNSNKRHFGILNISGYNSIILELYCDFKGVDIEEILKNKPHNIIRGITDDGKKITLLSYYHLTGSGNEIYKYRIKFYYCYIGEYIESIHTLYFKTVNLTISNLFGWFYMEELSLILKRNERQYIEKKVYESNNVDITLCYLNNVSDSDKTRKYIVERTCYLKVNFDKVKTVYELQDEIKYIQLLFSILMLRPVRIGGIKNPYKLGRFPETGELFIHDSLYFQDEVELQEATLHYSQYGPNNLQSIFEKWYSNREKYKPIIELLLSSYYSTESNILVKFLNIITAVESWHREIIQDTDPQNVLKYNQILELINDIDIKQWIAGKSIILQSVSLPKRLEYVLSKDRFNLVSNEKKFINICTNIRNSIAHNLFIKKSNFNPIDISLASRILKILLEVMIFEELNLTEEFIGEALNRNDSFKQVFISKQINGYTKF